MTRRQLPRATAAQLDAATFLPGEVAVDTDADELRYDGDGSTVGGIKVAKKSDVTALQALTAELGATPISAAMAPVVQAATLALGRTAFGLGTGDTPTLTGLVLTGAAAGGIALDINPTANSSAMGLDIDQSGPTNGASLGSEFYYNDILVNGDQGNASNVAYAFAVRYGVGGSNMQGQRTALVGRLVFNTASNASNPLKVYAGLSGEVQASAADGGSDTSSNSAGAFIASYASAVAVSGATNLRRVDGFEVNTSLRTGSSARWHRAAVIAQWADHAVSGAEVDAGLVFVNQNGAVGWAHHGIRFDSDQTGSGTLFKATATLIGSTGAETVTNGIDFTSFTFSGHSLKLPNFSVTNAGLASGTSLTLSDAAPRITVDETDGGSDQRKWLIRAVSAVLRIDTIDTAETTPVSAISISRTGTAIGTITLGGHVDLASGKVYRVNGTQVVTAQQAAIANLTLTYSANDPATTANSAVTFADGTALVAATMYEFADEVEAKLNAILGAMRTHGLIAT